MSTRLIHLSAAVVALALCGAGPPAGGDPKAVIRRAITAAGGEEALMRPPAVYRRLKISFPPQRTEKGVKIQVAPIVSAEDFVQAGGRPAKSVTVNDLDGRLSKSVSVMDGRKSWRSFDGKVESCSAEELEAIREYAHVGRAVRLVPLLNDREFALADLGEVKVGGRPAQGVKVSYRGKPAVRLYFDTGSSLLVKYSYRGKQPGWGKTPAREVLYEVTLADYREANLGAEEEKVLKAAGVGTDGTSLVAFLSRQGAGPAKSARVRELVKKLGDDSFAVREKAEAELVLLGPAALPALKEATEDDELEVVCRAQRCLKKIGERHGEKVVCAAVRLAAVRRPPGAVEALLDCLPGADEPVGKEVGAALASLAQGGGRPHPALVKALADKEPARREAARAVLGKDGGAYLRQPGRRLYTRGPKQPMRETFAIDGKVMTEREVIALWYFNRFDDKEFAKPESTGPGGKPGR
jgi:hypothetical protein